MKKVNLFTRQFINDNISINTTTSSYPLRKVNATKPTPHTQKDNKTNQAPKASSFPIK